MEKNNFRKTFFGLKWQFKNRQTIVTTTVKIYQGPTICQALSFKDIISNTKYLNEFFFFQFYFKDKNVRQRQVKQLSRSHSIDQSNRGLKLGFQSRAQALLHYERGKDRNGGNKREVRRQSIKRACFTRAERVYRTEKKGVRKKELEP